MTMSGGRDSAVWMGGTVAFLILAIVLPRFFFSGGGEETPAVTTSDSAGVTIVESRGSLWADGEGWSVAEEPLLRVGIVDGDPRYQFDGLTGMVRLGDGGLVVADGGSQEIRFFDSRGEWTATVGGPGGGPGEFTGLSGLGRDPAGRLWAYDFSLRRITWMTPGGEVEHLATLDPLPPTLNAVGALSDKTLILKQLWGSRAVAGAETEGLRRDPVAYVRFDSLGSLMDTVALVPGREVYVWEEDGRGVMGTPPYARNSVGTLWQGNLVVGSQETFQVESISPEGELLRRVRVDLQPPVLGEEDREAYIQARLAATPAQRRGGLREQIQGMAMPPTRPAYGSILADAVGNLWLGDWASGPDVPPAWTVLGLRGEWLGRVMMPAGFSPFEIGRDWVLGVQKDEMDVEYAVVYPLVKAEGES